MIPDISTGSRTRGLLAYLYGPGRRDEHTDPHIVAAWDTDAAPDPGRDPDAALTQLARRLDLHVDLRAKETGRRPPQHVWHCPVRTAPGDRQLTDTEWAEVARRILTAIGIAPAGDAQGCRWIAVRHADDHIHIVATTVRADGRRPRRHRDGQSAQAECRRIEADFGLRQLKPGDCTAAPRPTSAERAKAQRRGTPETPRTWLRTQVRAAVAASRTETEFFALLDQFGVTVRLRTAPSGDITGYAVAAPGDHNREGRPVFYGGAKLAADLTLPRIRERLNAGTPGPDQPATRPVHSLWDEAAEHLEALPGQIVTDDDAHAQGRIAALAEALDAMALRTPIGSQLRAAAVAFERAARSRRRAEHAAGATLREAVRALLVTPDSGQGGALAALLSAAVLAVAAAERWHSARAHAQQQEAARKALAALQAAYREAAAVPLAEYRHRALGPASDGHAAAVRRAVPEQADRILADPSWPALAGALNVTARQSGIDPAALLVEAAGQRELDTAQSPAEVLLWRIRRLGNRPNPRTAAATHRSPRNAHGADPQAPSLSTAHPTEPAQDDRRRHR